LRLPHVASRQIQCEDCNGDQLFNCKNSYSTFDAIDGEDLSNCIYAPMACHHVHDAYALGGVDFGYEVMGGGLTATNVAFLLNMVNGINDSYCCVLCVNGCKNVFGCVSLKKQ